MVVSRARFGMRAVAVAAGVPIAFALTATLLNTGTGTPQANAADFAPGTGSSSGVAGADGTADGGPGIDRSVRRDLVRTARPPMAISYRMPVNDRVVFITIDDGVKKDKAGLRYVERTKLPVTSFISAWAVKDSARYFTRISRWGSIQNHSATHASMARSSTDLEHEICYTQRALARDFGEKPWLMRPPYGAGSKRMEVQVTAARCGISDIVMWDAVVDSGQVSSANDRLRPGSIILLHFTPSLEKDLKAAVRAARKAGLTPASLADYLPRPL